MRFGSGVGSNTTLRGIVAAALLVTLAACRPGVAGGSAGTSTSATVVRDSALAVRTSASKVPFGTPITVSFTLTAAGAGIAGNAVVTVGKQTLPATTDGTGAGSLTIAADKLAAGQQTVSVAYAGDAAYKASTGDTSVMVEAAPATLALTLTPTPAGATNVVAAVASSTGVPTSGAVAFTVDGAAVSSQPVADGKASVDIPAGLAIGDHPVTAVFTADRPAEIAAATGTATLSITRSASTLTATGHKDTIRYGDKGYFNIAVQPLGAPPGTDLTGAVTVLDGTTTVAQGTTDPSGAAKLQFLNTADPGAKYYTVSYAGNATVAPSQYTVSIQTTQTDVDFSIKKPVLKPGESGTVTVSVVGTPVMPTGTVSVTVDGAEVVNGALDANGQISAPVSAVTAGSHKIKVSYSGDVRFEADTATSTLSVKPPLTNPNAAGAAAINANNPCPATAIACVDLSHNRTWLQRGGQVVYGPVKMLSGRKGYRTPAGTFSAYWFDKDHKSSLFDDASMPNSVFFNGGVAFHAGSLSTQSHGCIHLSNSASITFFNYLSVGDQVVVFGKSPY